MSLRDENLEKYEKYLLDEYIRILDSTMKQLNCLTKPPTIVQLKEMMFKRSFYVMVITLTILPFILVDKSEVTRLDDLMSSENKTEQRCYGGIYRLLLIERLKKFDKLGLLD